MPRSLTPLFLVTVLLMASCSGDGVGAVPTTGDSGSSKTTTTAPPSTSSPTSSSPGTTAAPDDPVPGRSAVPARLDYVLDGDSIEVQTDRGRLEVRLEAINTPEGDECWGDPARDATIEILEGADLLVEVLDEDQYGRSLAYVWADSTMLNLELLRRGAAIALVVEHDFLGEFLETEERAFSTGAGLWATDACGPATDARVAIRSVEHDPSGRDEDNPNGEIVVIVNDGDTADLSGWTLRDESSIHRFTFPAGFELATGDAVAVHSGCGDDRSGHLYWCDGDPVWSNGGDSALLLDHHGNVVDRYRYEGYLG